MGETESMQMGRDERDYVDSCHFDDCEMEFVGMTPDDVREHVVEDHDVEYGYWLVFPKPEVRERLLGSGDTE